MEELIDAGLAIFAAIFAGLAFISMWGICWALCDVDWDLLRQSSSIMAASMVSFAVSIRLVGDGK